jgi:hypothetical protein
MVALDNFQPREGSEIIDKNGSVKFADCDVVDTETRSKSGDIRIEASFYSTDLLQCERRSRREEVVTIF